MPRQLHPHPIACSDSSGHLVDEAGIDLAILKQVKEVERARIREYAARRASARFVPDASVWEVGGQIALPCATQNEIDGPTAGKLVARGCLAVGEGANMHYDVSA
ncbi:hypothetical protein ACN28E_29485 [Archangium lansingense]|uniref:hypothetical protein n=1 Tax=Archangium lansingense TaxID=2995310 RepID=UPI003B7CE3A7